MEATNLYHMNSSQAPKKWEYSAEAIKQKPKCKGVELSLQRFHIAGIDIAVWYVSVGGEWFPSGDPMVIKDS